jgi:hypothetical protein
VSCCFGAVVGVSDDSFGVARDDELHDDEVLD